jgi:hypothetical protein
MPYSAAPIAITTTVLAERFIDNLSSIVDFKERSLALFYSADCVTKLGNNQAAYCLLCFSSRNV